MVPTPVIINIRECQEVKNIDDNRLWADIDAVSVTISYPKWIWHLQRDLFEGGWLATSHLVNDYKKEVRSLLNYALFIWRSVAQFSASYLFASLM